MGSQRVGHDWAAEHTHSGPRKPEVRCKDVIRFWLNIWGQECCLGDLASFILYSIRKYVESAHSGLEALRVITGLRGPQP